MRLQPGEHTGLVGRHKSCPNLAALGHTPEWGQLPPLRDIEPMGKHILKGYVKGKNVILVICLTVMQKKKLYTSVFIIEKVR